jgi:EAL domain-containing protein (putative c-di-GMP-specific phosphodiesterase class I)
VIPRWVDPTLGEVPLARFIPVAEENGLIHRLFELVLKQACTAAASWPDDVTLALDIFPTQLKDHTLNSMVQAILTSEGIRPERLELEVAESTLVSDLEGAQDVLGSLRELGVRLVLDKFGTGYSSLYHLRNFKLDKIKIDRTFIESLESKDSAGVVSALVGLGRGLGLTIIADGVEAPEQQGSLITAGCEQGQGGFFGGPVSAQEATSLCDAQRPG